MPERRPEEKRGADSDISAFLEAHPTGPLTVAVGYAGVRGLAWLARRTGTRRVILVIGDCRAPHFTKVSDTDRDRVLRFLDRNDVEVKNWYRRRTEKSEAHLRTCADRTAILALIHGPRSTAASSREDPGQDCCSDAWAICAFGPGLTDEVGVD